MANCLLLEAVLIGTILLKAEMSALTCFVLHGAGFCACPACNTAQHYIIQNKLQCVQVNGCVGPAKCLRNSNAKKGCPKPRSAPLAGRCRGGSWREAPRLYNAPFAQSGRAPSGAQPTASLGCMRFATDLLKLPHQVYQHVSVNTPCQPTLLLVPFLPRSPLTCGAFIIQCCITSHCF